MLKALQILKEIEKQYITHYNDNNYNESIDSLESKMMAIAEAIAELEEFLNSNDTYLKVVNECKRLEKEVKENKSRIEELDSMEDKYLSKREECEELEDKLDTYLKQEQIFSQIKNFDIQFINGKYRFIIEADKDFTSKSYSNLIDDVFKYLKESKNDLKAIKKEWYENANIFPCLVVRSKGDVDIAWKYEEKTKNIFYTTSYENINGCRLATKEEALSLVKRN